MTNMDQAALDAFAEAVVDAHDPLERLRRAVVAAWDSPSPRADSRREAARIHAERTASGFLLRISDVQSGRSVDVELPADAARGLSRFLGAAPRR